MARLTCTHHPHQPAAFHCMACGVHVCPECTEHRWAGSGFVDHCQTCQRALEPLSPGQIGSTTMPGPRAFIDRIPRLLLFPVDRSVLIMLAGLALLTAPITWAADNNIVPWASAVGHGLVRGFELWIYFWFASQTAFGRDHIDVPDFTSIADDILAPIVRYMAALLPLALGLIWFGSAAFDSAIEGIDHLEREPLDTLSLMTRFSGPALVIALGVFLLPLLTIIAAVAESLVSVLDPRIWLHSLGIMGRTYAVGAAAFYVVFIVELIVWTPIMLVVQHELSIPVLTTLLTTFAMYLPMALRARILGAIVEPYFDVLTQPE